MFTPLGCKVVHILLSQRFFPPALIRKQPVQNATCIIYRPTSHVEQLLVHPRLFCSGFQRGVLYGRDTLFLMTAAVDWSCLICSSAPRRLRHLALILSPQNETHAVCSLHRLSHSVVVLENFSFPGPLRTLTIHTTAFHSVVDTRLMELNELICILPMPADSGSLVHDDDRARGIQRKQRINKCKRALPSAYDQVVTHQLVLVSIRRTLMRCMWILLQAHKSVWIMFDRLLNEVLVKYIIGPWHRETRKHQRFISIWKCTALNVFTGESVVISRLI